jgi:hypothetical protein
MPDKKTNIFEEENDFGFSFTSEKELIQTENEIEYSLKGKYKNKLNKVYNMITPLLDNLQKNPEKDYIKWPNRFQKVEEFRKKLKQIVDTD